MQCVACTEQRALVPTDNIASVAFPCCIVAKIVLNIVTHRNRQVAASKAKRIMNDYDVVIILYGTQNTSVIRQVLWSTDSAYRHSPAMTAPHDRHSRM